MQPKKDKMAFLGLLSQIKFLFGPLVLQLVWYILKQLLATVSVKGPIRPEEAIQLRGPGVCSPPRILKIFVAKDAISCVLWGTVNENEL